MTRASRESDAESQNAPRYFNVCSPIKWQSCDHQPIEEEDGSARLMQNQWKKQSGQGALCGGMYINCLTLDLNIYASSLWLAASLLTLGLVELLKNRWYWRVFIITAEMSTNKEAKRNHWHTNCHHCAQHTPQTHTPYRESLKYYPSPQKRCRVAGPGVTVSLCR